jgi:hypothetical protein
MTRKALSIPEQASYALRVSFCAAGAGLLAAGLTVSGL